MVDIRECFVWLEYTNGHTAKLKVWLVGHGHADA